MVTYSAAYKNSAVSTVHSGDRCAIGEEQAKLPLDQYRRKRSAERTPEPFGGADGRLGSSGRGMFVVQKHAARRLHYDFRLEMEGVLRSWAIPKGPSHDPAQKRLAVMVEDHPIDYGDFEGVIPQGNYGAGAVIVWDRGEYHSIDPPSDAAAAVRAGKLDLELRGFKLRGAYTLVRTRGMPGRKTGDKEQWLLIKKRDPFAAGDDVAELHPRSVLSGLTIEELRDGSQSGAEINAQLKHLKAPKLSVALEPKSFPLNLAKLAYDPPEDSAWLFELKYDGVRGLAIRDRGPARLFGRKPIEITARYPEVALALNALAAERFVLDGEIVVLGDDGRPSFQLLQRRMHQSDSREIGRLSLGLPANYYVFDLLAFGEFDLRTIALEERKELLSRLIAGDGPLRYCEHLVGHGKAFFAEASGAGLEGILAKRRNSPYRGLRSDDWIKVKCPSTDLFVIGGWTDPGGARRHFGALLLGQYEGDGGLRYITKVGTGFDETLLSKVHGMMKDRARADSPFRRALAGEPTPERASHFCEPQLVCEVQFSEWTDDGGLRHPSFKRLIDDADPHACNYPNATPPPQKDGSAAPELLDPEARARANDNIRESQRQFIVTNPEKVFWPSEGYTKKDLIDYYVSIAHWMLSYLKDRPVVLTRYPDGVEGKSFFQKDAPGFVPGWIRTEKVYSDDSKREISYFILDSAEAIGYMANLGAIPIHIWSSHLPRLEHPDWLLFDIDPKGSTTARAVRVALEVAALLREVGMRPCVKTSGQAGLHVVVALKPKYTYEQARLFAELASRLIVMRAPDVATLIRAPHARGGRVYIDYLQLGYGKTIAGPFAVRPVPGAPVSAPLQWRELEERLDPGIYNIKTMAGRMKRLRHDPFIAALEDQQTLEEALPRLESLLNRGPGAKRA